MVHSVVSAVVSAVSARQRQSHHHQVPPDSPVHPLPPPMFPPSDSPDRKDLPRSPKSPKSAALNSPIPRLRPTLERGPTGELVTRSEIKDGLDGSQGEDIDPTKIKKTLWDLIALTISMAGAQVAWTVELGFVSVLVGIEILNQLTCFPQIWHTIPPWTGLICSAYQSCLARRPYQWSCGAAPDWQVVFHAQ